MLQQLKRGSVESWSPTDIRFGKSSPYWYEIDILEKVRKQIKTLQKVRHAENLKHYMKMGLLALRSDNPMKSDVLTFLVLLSKIILFAEL